MNQILEGQEGVLCHMDDILIFGGNQEEHDKRLHAVLQKITAAGATLNQEKCEFNKKHINFLGHVIDEKGISQDPHKTTAIIQTKQPKTTIELRRFLGMVNQLSKFTPKVAELSQPLHEILSNKKMWMWDSAQEIAFERLKKELIKPTVLAIYNPEAPTKISADASTYGIGAVLM